MPRPGMSSEELDLLWQEWAVVEQLKRYRSTDAIND
jgi:hypothetical protein